MLRRDHRPAGILVPVGVGRKLLGVVFRLEHEGHAEIPAPPVELDLVVAPARLGSGAQRHPAGLQHHRLEIDRA